MLLGVCMIAIRHVLVATDFSPVSETALQYGQVIADQFKARLTLVHIVQNIALKNITAEGFVAPMAELQRDLEDASRTRLDETVAALRHHAPDADGRIIISGATADAIVSYAQEANIDLIVIGTHGHGGMSRLLLGSVAERVVRTARCPVLTVHHPERDLLVRDASTGGAAA